jgi:phosphoribosylglycinamide formyltransferase-1
MSGRIGVLVSGSGTNLAALIDAFSVDDTAAEIAVVISNKADAFGLERARRAGIPAVAIAHTGKRRSEFDAELVAVLRAHRVEWVALAGFMRILTPIFLDAFSERVINIHPSLLPRFPGVAAQQQAFDAGVDLTGATVHFVDAGTDTGPIIAQGTVPRLADDTAADLRARILHMEHQLFPMVLGLATAGRLAVVSGSVTIDGEHRDPLWHGLSV